MLWGCGVCFAYHSMFGLEFGVLLFVRREWVGILVGRNFGGKEGNDCMNSEVL